MICRANWAVSAAIAGRSLSHKTDVRHDSWWSEILSGRRAANFIRIVHGLSTHSSRHQRSELEAHSQLENARKIRLRGDLPEGRRVNIGLGPVELRRVGEVEDFAPELRPKSLQGVALE